MSILSDDELILMIRMNNDLALRLIYGKYESFLRTWALKSLHTQKAKQVELDDMMQVGRIEFWNVLKKYRDEEGNFFSFCKMCVEREYYNYIRGYFINTVANYSEISFDSPVQEGSNYTYLETFESTELSANPIKLYELREELDQIYATDLSEDEQRVLEMKMLGYSYNEIAEKIQKTRKQVDNLLAKIKTKVLIKR
jgi:RNA polymerase sporulation-specific sigma factor